MAGRGKPRVRGRTMEEHVWRWLRKQDNPVKLAEVMRAFDLPRHTASNTMRRLVIKKSAVRTGTTHTVRFEASGRNPDDMRGTALNTLRTLQKFCGQIHYIDEWKGERDVRRNNGEGVERDQ